MPATMETETITLLFDRVAIKVDAPEETWGNGPILKPDIAKVDPDRPRGTVVAVGPGGVSDEGVQVDMFVRVGDRVIFQKYGAQPIEVDGEKLHVAEQKQIICLLNRGE